MKGGKPKLGSGKRQWLAPLLGALWASLVIKKNPLMNLLKLARTLCWRQHKLWCWSKKKNGSKACGYIKQHICLFINMYIIKNLRIKSNTKFNQTQTLYISINFYPVGVTIQNGSYKPSHLILTFTIENVLCVHTPPKLEDVWQS